MTINSKIYLGNVATLRVIFSIMAMACSLGVAADGVIGNTPQPPASSSLTSYPQGSTTQTIASLSANVTQLTERVRALEEKIATADAVLKLFKDAIDRPVVVDWLEGDVGTNKLQNPPNTIDKHSSGR